VRRSVEKVRHRSRSRHEPERERTDADRLQSHEDRAEQGAGGDLHARSRIQIVSPE
jgi:hypothetical protein